MTPLALTKIIWIDILLSGDNAIVIAAVCSTLPRTQRLGALIFGMVLAIALRILFTSSAAYLLTLPGLRLVGGLALLYIAVKLLIPDSDDAEHKSASTLFAAILAISVADLSMSIDNILAIAAAANGDIILLGVGLAFSMSFIMFAAGIITRIIDKAPILIWGGAALLGWIAGGLIASDPLTGVNTAPEVYSAAGSAFVPIAGLFWLGLTGKLHDGHAR